MNDLALFVIRMPSAAFVVALAIGMLALTWRAVKHWRSALWLRVGYVLTLCLSIVALVSLWSSSVDRLSLTACLTGHFGLWIAGLVAMCLGSVSLALIGGTLATEGPQRDRLFLMLCPSVAGLTFLIFLRSAGSCTV